MATNPEVIGCADERVNVEALFAQARNQVLRSLINADDRRWEAMRPKVEHTVREVKREPVRRSWKLLSLVRP